MKIRMQEIDSNPNMKAAVNSATFTNQHRHSKRAETKDWLLQSSANLVCGQILSGTNRPAPQNLCKSMIKNASGAAKKSLPDNQCGNLERLEGIQK